MVFGMMQISQGSCDLFARLKLEMFNLDVARAICRLLTDCASLDNTASVLGIKMILARPAPG